MNTKQAAIGRWPEILEYYGLPPITGKHHFKGNCPLCGSKGKFRCDDKNGTGAYICTCGSGDGWALLAGALGKEFKVLAAEVDKLIGRDYTPDGTVPVPSGLASLRDRVSRKFAKLIPLRGTGADNYLKSRGINCLPMEHVRFCDRQRAAGGQYQSIYALATDDKGALCYLHRTLLDGDRKANAGDAQKKLMKLQEDNYLEFARSIAIRMFPPSETLGIAEGIETALSCKVTTGVNTWSVMNAGFMEKFRAPLGVKHLIIFADMDIHSATGQAAAFACARANLKSKNDLQRVTIRWPDEGDFNDMLIHGCRVREQTYTKKVAA